MSFSRDSDPSTAAISRVPLRAKNNLGRLSPAAQDQIAQLLEAEGAPSVALQPDVATLQKIFGTEKALKDLKRPDFKKLRVSHEGQQIVFGLEGGAAILGMSLATFSAAMSKPLV